MAFSSGTYTLPGAALSTGDTVSATDHNQVRNDMATAFNLTWLRNGTAAATANIPMGGFKLTGLAAATTAGDAVRYEQFASPPAIGGTAAAAGAFTTLTSSSDSTLNGLTVGKGAGSVSTNTAVGASALASNTTGANQTAVGKSSLASNTTGTENTAFGVDALTTNTTGNNNVGIGLGALKLNTTGANNTALGYLALLQNTTASNNTAVGYQAGYANTTGYDNTFIGYSAGGSNTTGYYNTFVGDYSGYSHTTGVWNTCIGKNSGYALTTGSKNTIIGGFNGNAGGLNITTSSNYIVLSDGDGNPRGIFTDTGSFLAGTVNTNWSTINHNIVAPTGNTDWALAVGKSDATVGNCFGLRLVYSAATPNNTGNQYIACSDSTAARFYVRSNGGVANYSANNVNLSDSREKTNANPAGSYLDKICSIPVRTYNYIDQNLEEDAGLTLGVFAQDVQEVAPELVTESNWGTEETPKMRLSIYQTDLQYALMKALQELKAEFDAYKATHP